MEGYPAKKLRKLDSRGYAARPTNALLEKTFAGGELAPRYDAKPFSAMLKRATRKLAASLGQRHSVWPPWCRPLWGGEVLDGMRCSKGIQEAFFSSLGSG